MRPATLIAAMSAALLTTSIAWPGPSLKRGGHEHLALATGPLRYGRSIGSPNEGKLIGGTRIEETTYLRVVPSHSGGDVRWGLEPLVTAIDRAARQVRRQYPDSITWVGHLSRAGGGEVERHKSHESGRDADVLFFAKNKAGKALACEQFRSYLPDGSCPHWPGASFDDARNWLFVQALVTDPEARVTNIFVATGIRSRLLSYAERIGAPQSVRIRAAEVMIQPRGLPHDDHFHVRIGCPSHMQGCIEFPTATRTKRAPHKSIAGRERGDAKVLKKPAPATTKPATKPVAPRAPVEVSESKPDEEKLPGSMAVPFDFNPPPVTHDGDNDDSNEPEDD